MNCLYEGSLSEFSVNGKTILIPDGLAKALVSNGVDFVNTRNRKKNHINTASYVYRVEFPDGRVVYVLGLSHAYCREELDGSVGAVALAVKRYGNYRGIVIQKVFHHPVLQTKYVYDADDSFSATCSFSTSAPSGLFGSEI